MTRAQMKQQAKESLSGNWGTAIAVLLIGYIIAGVLTAGLIMLAASLGFFKVLFGG